jgi:hypothetical protein
MYGKDGRRDGHVTSLRSAEMVYKPLQWTSRPAKNLHGSSSVMKMNEGASPVRGAKAKREKNEDTG